MKKLILIAILTSYCSFAYAQKQSIDLSYKMKTEYNDEVVYKSKIDSVTVFEKIVIDGFDSKIPFYLIRSSKASGNKYVILQHGMGGSKDNWLYTKGELTKKYKQIKDSLLFLGYNLIIPDAKYHGERTYEANFTPANLLIQPSKLSFAQNMFITSSRDIRIIMDYIEAENPKKKISFSYIGYSMGGNIGVLLNSVENRFQGVVVCVAALDAVKTSIEVFGWKDMEASNKLNYISPNNYGAFQKTPICLLMGKTDKYYTEKETKEFFESILLADKSLKFYNSGHYLPQAFVNDAINWITTHNK